MGVSQVIITNAIYILAWRLGFWRDHNMETNAGLQHGSMKEKAFLGLVQKFEV